MLQRCPTCRGKKDVMGAGMIFHKCKMCLGVGHVNITEDEELFNKLAGAVNLLREQGVPEIEIPTAIPRKRKKTK